MIISITARSLCCRHLTSLRGFVGFVCLFFVVVCFKGNSCIKGKFSVMFFFFKNFYFSLQRLVSDMSKRPVQE